MKVGANVKKQAVQAAKSVAEEVLREPGKVLKTAGDQTGVVPAKSQETNEQPNQDIQVAKDNDAVFAGRRIEEIEGELARIRQEKEQEEKEEQALEIQEREAQEQQKDKKPMFSIPTKKKKGAIPARVKKHSGTSELRLKE